MTTQNTPEKTYRIGEAARLLDLETHVLRFWESEFPQLNPLRTPKGQRLYTDEHLALLQRVKYLLYDEGLTIDGARKALARPLDEPDSTVPHSVPNAALAHMPQPNIETVDIQATPAALCADNALRQTLHHVRTELRMLHNALRKLD